MDESTKIELIIDALQHAKDVISLACRSDNEQICNMLNVTDKELKEYYYELNDMCIKLTDRNVMRWQKEE